jgi:hypothetical protein
MHAWSCFSSSGSGLNPHPSGICVGARVLICSFSPCIVVYVFCSVRTATLISFCFPFVLLSVCRLGLFVLFAYSFGSYDCACRMLWPPPFASCVLVYKRCKQQANSFCSIGCMFHDKDLEFCQLDPQCHHIPCINEPPHARRRYFLRVSETLLQSRGPSLVLLSSQLTA